MRDRTGKELTTHELLVKGLNRIDNIILEFCIYLLHLVGYVPSHHLRRLAYRMAGVRIGKGSTLHMGTKFYDPRNIRIGEDSVIGEGVILDGRERLEIGNHVDIASEVMIYNAEHDIHSENFDPITAPVNIEDYVFIGPRALVLPGIRIGRGAVVAAGAVVTKDVSELTIVGGVPAKPIGQRKVKDLHYLLGRARWFR